MPAFTALPYTDFDHMVYLCLTCRQLWLEIWQYPGSSMGGGCPRCELTRAAEWDTGMWAVWRP